MGTSAHKASSTEIIHCEGICIRIIEHIVHSMNSVIGYSEFVEWALCSPDLTRFQQPFLCGKQKTDVCDLFTKITGFPVSCYGCLIQRVTRYATTRLT